MSPRFWSLPAWDTEKFLNHIMDRLGKVAINYESSFKTPISGAGIGNSAPAGVLLPLINIASSSQSANWHFQLIKRSSLVSQAGDLSCPGGMLHPHADRFFGQLLLLGILPSFNGKARRLALERSSWERRLMLTFLANSLRESWEEIRLAPWLVRFLGPLPTYNLIRFQRTIFPLVGYIEWPTRLSPNKEVAKLIQVPLAAFGREESIGCLSLFREESDNTPLGSFPCLVLDEPDGGREILWGATFNIIIRFLEIVFDYKLCDWREGRQVRHVLSPAYLHGRL